MRRRLRLALLATLLALAVPGAEAAIAPTRIDVDLGDDGRLRWERGSSPVLLVGVRSGDGWITLARRVTGRDQTAAAIRAANPKLADPLRDRPVSVPLELARGDIRLRALARLFPVDRRVALGYRHIVLDPFADGSESWEWLAAVFTGRPSRQAELKRANPELAVTGLRRGAAVLVPEGLLAAAFRQLAVVTDDPPTPTVTAVPTATPSPTPTATPSATPTTQPSPTPTALPSATSTATPPPAPTILPSASPTVAATASPSPPPTASPLPTVIARSVNGDLAYGRDELGEHAVYRLRRGEALYSAVVVRFTGQLLAVEVNETAQEIARRSGIANVTSIPIGYPVKIPLDLLLPEFLPRDSEAYRQWAAERTELAGFFELVRAVDLSGVHVIVDPGHGGGDTGAVFADLWEATYAYDIAVRVKHNLERHTRATVWMTREDTISGFKLSKKDRLEQHRRQVLRTSPRFDLSDSRNGVHLRWCLGNSIVGRLATSGTSAARVVFLSIHADSLHPSVRGAMAYVPARSLRGGDFRLERASLAGFAEYRSGREVALSPAFRAKAEASSRHLADSILDRLRLLDIAVHPHEPVRDRVRRGRSTWVPAVLKYSRAQNAVLLECSNLANAEDREQLLAAEWRERFARGVVEGLAAAFDGS